MAYKTIYNPGSFNHTIEIQSYTTTIDDFGIPKEDWVTTRKTRCIPRNNMSTSKMEFYKAMGVNCNSIKEFIVRYKEDFDSKTRVIYKGRIYDVFKVDNIDEESIYQQISAKLVD